MTLRYARKTPETHPLVAGRDYLLRISESLRAPLPSGIILAGTSSG
jgi:hypothetical protein